MQDTVIIPNDFTSVYIISNEKKDPCLKICSEEKLNFIVELWVHFEPNFKSNLYIIVRTMYFYVQSKHKKETNSLQ